MSAQDITLQQYHQWMKINATSHLIRTARQINVFAELRKGQRTLEQLCEAQDLKSDPTSLLLDALIAIGIVEKYGEDYALARAAHLLCQYDDDLGDARWQRLADAAQGNTSGWTTTISSISIMPRQLNGFTPRRPSRPQKSWTSAGKVNRRGYQSWTSGAGQPFGAARWRTAIGKR